MIKSGFQSLEDKSKLLGSLYLQETRNRAADSAGVFLVDAI